MQLILVRHGLPQTLPGLTPADPPLSATGQQQAEMVGRYLAEHPIDLIVHSGMARARDTSMPLAKRLELTPVVSANLGEVDRYGVDYANSEIIRARGDTEWKRFLADPIAYFGVDEREFRRDTLAAFDELLATDGADSIAIFTHGFPINILLSQALGLPGIAHFLPSYGSVTRLAGSSLERLAVISVNETAHLSDRFAGGER